MLVKQLRESIEDARDILKAAGNIKAETAFDEIAAALATVDGHTVDDLVQSLAREACANGSPEAQAYAERLIAAGFDEAAFLEVWRQIEADRSLKKGDLQNLANAYLGRFDKKASIGVLKSDIKRGFYTRVYDRDAQAMANRATPW